MDGSDKKTVLSAAIEDPEGIAVDWVGNNLYIVETLVGRIDVCDFDGQHRSNILSDGLVNPRGIALDSTKG